MKNQDLCFGYLGNGITVFDKSREKWGDYKTVAHISERGHVKYYADVSPEWKEIIEREARELQMLQYSSSQS